MFPSPLIAAPMAGGVSTTALVTAVGRAGGLGFLAGGYKPVDALRGEIAEMTASGLPFGVNLFVPDPPRGQPALSRAHEVLAYRSLLAPLAARYDVTLPHPAFDDDAWDAKVELLLADPVPYLSLTFGLPDRSVIDALQARGTLVIATVTCRDELVLAQERGVDAAVIQHSSAGGHSAAFLASPTTGASPGHPQQPTPADAAALTAALLPHATVPLIAAGGLASAADIRAALRAGATAVQLGTLFLRTPESGAKTAHKAALGSPTFTTTALTRAFSGRQARGLENLFMREHPEAPQAYPELHHLTAPIRAAAAAAGDPESMALWAGTGFRAAQELGAAEVLTELLSGLPR